MSKWVSVGDNLLNVDNIEYIERRRNNVVIVHMCSGKVVELTNTVGIVLLNYISSELLKFLDRENPERDFS